MTASVFTMTWISRIGGQENLSTIHSNTYSISFVSFFFFFNWWHSAFQFSNAAPITAPSKLPEGTSGGQTYSQWRPYMYKSRRNVPRHILPFLRLVFTSLNTCTDVLLHVSYKCNKRVSAWKHIRSESRYCSNVPYCDSRALCERGIYRIFQRFKFSLANPTQSNGWYVCACPPILVSGFPWLVLWSLSSKKYVLYTYYLEPG
jgi:hypothetical protein